MDRLRAFEVFVTVVGRQGFARAAETLDTSPANVTRYIADLEAHLGTRLLNRHSRKLSLTESGEALYERARAILADVDEAEAVSSSAAVRPQGRLRILGIHASIHLGVVASSLQHLDRALAQFEEFCTVTQSVRQAIPVRVTVVDADGATLHDQT